LLTPERRRFLLSFLKAFFLAPQAVEAVEKWESAFWISTFPGLNSSRTLSGKSLL